MSLRCVPGNLLEISPRSLFSQVPYCIPYPGQTRSTGSCEHSATCWLMPAACTHSQGAGRTPVQTAGGCSLLPSARGNQVRATVRSSTKCPRDVTNVRQQRACAGHDKCLCQVFECVRHANSGPSPAQFQSQGYHGSLPHTLLSPSWLRATKEVPKQVCCTWKEVQDEARLSVATHPDS